MLTWEIDTKQDKGATWYVTAGIFSLALIVWGIWVGLYVMSIVIFILAGVYILIDNNAPERVTITVNENGIMIASSFYDYPKIESFSIVYDDGKPVLLRLKTTVRGLKNIDVELNNQVNPAELRGFLGQYAAEEENGGELTNTERLTRYLKI